MDNNNTHAKNSVVVPLTVETISAKKYATRVAANPARKILRECFIVQAATKLSKVCLEGRERTALSQYPSATPYVKDSYLVGGTSARCNAIMVNACAVKRWSIRAVSATNQRQSSPVIRSTILISSVKNT